MGLVVVLHQGWNQLIVQIQHWPSIYCTFQYFDIAVGRVSDRRRHGVVQRLFPATEDHSTGSRSNRNGISRCSLPGRNLVEPKHCQSLCYDLSRKPFAPVLVTSF